VRVFTKICATSNVTAATIANMKAEVWG
jgi:hypothetical protein